MGDGGDGGKAYDGSVVVHLGEEVFERSIFSRGEFGLGGRCDWVGLFFCRAGRSWNECGCGIG